MAYIGQEPGQGQAERFIFTASGNETSVTTADDGRVIGYTVGQVSVYLNGVKLVVGTDCVATNGSTIASLSALSANDVIEVIALSAFSPADTVSAASGGTFSGVVTLPSPVINTGVSGSAILDEDAMGSNSATKIATQQSIKAYVDSIGTNSSITTLGTVTAGNLSNTNIVYPAGHVIKSEQYTSTASLLNSVGSYTTIMTQAYTGTAGNLLMITAECKMSIRTGYFCFGRTLYDGAMCGSFYIRENSTNAHGTLLGPVLSMTGVVVCGSGSKNILLQADNTSVGAVTMGGNNRITVIEIQQ